MQTLVGRRHGGGVILVSVKSYTVVIMQTLLDDDIVIVVVLLAIDLCLRLFNSTLVRFQCTTLIATPFRKSEKRQFYYRGRIHYSKKNMIRASERLFIGTSRHKRREWAHLKDRREVALPKNWNNN